MVRTSTVQLTLHPVSPILFKTAEKHFLPPEMFDYFSDILELSYSPARP